MDAKIADQLERLLKEALTDIEMPDSYYAKAESRYKSVSKYLAREDSSLAQYKPEIFLQGSIKTGTAIRPIAEEGSYDVDVVCNLSALKKSAISQKELKSLIGEEVKDYSSIHGMKKEPHDGKRCWTLEYVDEANFHMDILPTVDNAEWQSEAIRSGGLTYKPDDKFLAHTDKRRDGFDRITLDWPTTNPSGYAEWFLSAARIGEFRLLAIARRAYASVEEMKEYEVKAPLQQYVQILKRHRDVWLEKRPGSPALRSIVITTLVGKAYENIDKHEGWLEDFLRIVERMPSFIDKTDEGYRLCNPANRLENFLDGWATEDAISFNSWMEAVVCDLLLPVHRYDHLGSARSRVRSSLGLRTDEGTVSRAASELLRKVASLQHREPLNLPMINIEPVSIHAEKCWGGGRFKKFVSGAPLPKNAELRFYAVADNLKDYEVRWQVTNDGYEARRAGCLRGDFYGGKTVEGRCLREEKTAYLGEHYVECYLIKDGNCLGHSEPFVVNITNTQESFRA